MQLVDFSKPLASRRIINYILEILRSRPRNINQLELDVLSKHSLANDCLLNTTNLLIDHGLVHSSTAGILFCDDKLSNNDYSAIARATLQEGLLSTENVSYVSKAIVGSNDYGLCLDGLRISKKSHSLPHIFFSLGILGMPKSDRFWPVEVVFQDKFVSILASTLTEDWELQSGMTLAALKAKMQNQELAGEDAEIWVLTLEKLRLREHPLKHLIKRVSDTNVSAGFDIASFKNNKSFNYDRFVEVKSYKGQAHFFISKNELLKARELGSNYSIILVDRDKMPEQNYLPKEFINPYNTLIVENVPEGVTVEPTDWMVRFD